MVKHTKHLTFQIFFVLIASLGPIACDSSDDPPDTGDNPIKVITDVTVIPMNVDPDESDQQHFIEHQTVIINDGIITTITDASLATIPENAQIIDGTGRFLIPGLVDMHVHFHDRNELDMFVAYGVTTVRNMGDYPEPSDDPDSWRAEVYYESTVEVRDRVESGEWLGPDMYLAGHILDGPKPTFAGLTTPIESENDIAEVIRNEHETGYDYIKIYDLLPASYMPIIVEEAARYGMPIVGHAPLSLSFDEALQSGLTTNEHLTMFRNYPEIEPIFDQVGEMTAEAGIWSCPTLIALSHVVPPESEPFEAFFNEPEWRYLSENTKQFLEDFLTNVRYEVYMGEYLDVYFFPLTALLNESGAGLIMGTDAPFSLPGVSAHQELELLVTAGLTPYEALRTATYNGAVVLEQESVFGTVETNRRADLILLEESPLTDISNTRSIAGVMLRGKWFPREDLDTLLESLERR